MKKDEMIRRLKCLKACCEAAQERNGEMYVLKGDTEALEMAIDLLDEGYIDDIQYIRDLINFLFIFIGIFVVLAIVIAYRL